MDVGIDSIVAIPIDEWSLDYVTPQLNCVRKNGICLPTLYPDAPDPAETALIPFLPSTGQDQPQFFYIDGSSPIPDINGRVPNPGLYILVAQYKHNNPGSIGQFTEDTPYITIMRIATIILPHLFFSEAKLDMNVTWANQGEGKSQLLLKD